MKTILYPLLTERKIVSPIWGGNRLASWLNMPPPHPSQIGETWQVYDTNHVTNGPLARYTLTDIVKLYGPLFVGQRSFERYGADFPLLAKFIDAAESLSIQVHPDDHYAHTVEATTGFHGKAEAWYILDTDPGADITYGLRDSMSRESFAAAVQSGNFEHLLQHLPVAPNHTIFVPAGTIHAINAGIVLFEIQQKSNLTYRVYDYNRCDPRTGQLRELHLEKALEVSNFEPPRYGWQVALPLGPQRDLLVACVYFALERWQIDAVAQMQNQESFEILTLIDGKCTLIWPTGELSLFRGDSVVIPASLKDWLIKGKTTILRAYVPDLDALTNELRFSGYSEADIQATIHYETVLSR